LLFKKHFQLYNHTKDLGGELISTIQRLETISVDGFITSLTISYKDINGKITGPLSVGMKYSHDQLYSLPHSQESFEMEEGDRIKLLKCTFVKEQVLSIKIITLKSKVWSFGEDSAFNKSDYCDCELTFEEFLSEPKFYFAGNLTYKL